MKNYSYLVNKHFKVNKRRNLLTIMGIVFSMILFISTGCISNYMRDINIANAKQTNGNYEAVLNEVNINDIDKIINNVKVLEYGLYKLENSLEINVGDVKKTLDITALDNNSTNNIFKENFKITEGKIPAKIGEIALTELAKGELNKEIGDTLVINNNEYKVVGFYEDNSSGYYYKLTGISYLDINKIESNVSIAFNLKDKNNKLKTIKELGLLVNKVYSPNDIDSEIQVNKPLFYAYGIGILGDNIQLSKEKISSITINIIIAILTIMFIYSSINISFKERVQQFSTLRCLGATSGKIKFMLLKESMLLGTYSVIPGTFLGVFLSWIITDVIFVKIIGVNNYGISFKMYYEVIVIAIIMTIINIFIATILPILTVKNITPIDGIKNIDSTNCRVKKRKSKIIRKIFGYKGELAYKNIASNSRSFFVITLALTMILVVFTSFSGYYIYTVKTYNYQRERAYDVTATFSLPFYEVDEDKKLNDLVSKADSIKQDVSNANVATDSLMNITTKVNVTLKGFKINPKLKVTDNVYKNLFIESDSSIINKSAIMLIYDNESINKILPYIDTSYSFEENITSEDFVDNGFILVNSGYANSKPSLIPEEREITIDLDEDKNASIKANYLGSIDHRDLVGAERFGYYNYLTIIVSRDFYDNNKELLDKYNERSSSVNLSLNFNEKNNSDLFKIEKIISQYGGYYLEPKKDLQYFQNSFDALSVIIFTVLFLTMIIGGINIINTRTINIILRKKEFGTLLAVGMKSNDVKKLIILEGIVQWFISASIGVIISIISLKIINIIMQYSEESEMYSMPFLIIIVGVLLILFINLLSSILPYKRFKNLDVSELLRSDE